MIWTFLWAVYAVRIHLGLVIKVNSIFMTTRQDLEPHFPILNNSNVLVVSGLLWGTVCPVCGLFAVKFVKYEVANDIPVPMGKENPIYDLPRGILHTVYHRLFSQRKWWDSCCPNHLNPICGMFSPLFCREDPLVQRWDKAGNSALQPLVPNALWPASEGWPWTLRTTSQPQERTIFHNYMETLNWEEAT